MRHTAVVVGLLLLFWASRIAALDLLPLHNDEGLHLTRAVEVWNLHPFWDINDGKIINHWPIAAFYPQYAPAFTGRMATVFVALVGLAAGVALARRLAGDRGAALAAVLWIASPYLFFYERLALSDAEAGALVVLALYFAERLISTHQRHYALLTGLALGLAGLFKFTAAPFAASVLVVVALLGPATPRQRLTHLILIALVTALCFVGPFGYMLLRGRGFFEVALGWIGVGSTNGGGIAGNLERLWAQFGGYGTYWWALATAIGLIGLLWRRGKTGIVWLLALLVPLAAIIMLGNEVLPRHYVVALPLALTLAGAGLAIAAERLFAPRWRTYAIEVVALLVTLALVPFALQAYSDSGSLPLPALDRAQFITDHSSGYGLREAILNLPETVQGDIPVVGSMFPDSCRRANFYATSIRLICGDAPGLPAIENALSEHSEVYILTDHAPRIGIDVSTLDAQAVIVARYPRPGETDVTASVILWHLTQPDTP